MTRRALVLAGGDIKGAYQAGAIEAVLRDGWVPDIITGISVGALNAGLLAEFAGFGEWEGAGRRLGDFWRNEVTRPGQFVSMRGWLDMALRFGGNRWAGVMDTAGLRQRVSEVMHYGDLARCPAEVFVGAACLRTGQIVYADVVRQKGSLDWIMASASIPILMPGTWINGDLWHDGGIRDIAPLAKAIELGADQIVVIATSPAQTEVLGTDWKAESLIGQVSRTLDVMCTELLANDLATAENVNDLVVEGAGDPKHRYLDIEVIRPSQVLRVSSVTKFTQRDIQQMVTLGSVDAQLVIDKRADRVFFGEPSMAAVGGA